MGVIGFVRQSKQCSVKPTKNIGSGVNEWYPLSKIKYEGFSEIVEGTLTISKKQAEESF